MKSALPAFLCFDRAYADYEALMEAATESWREVCLDPEKIRSICAAPYLAARR